MSSGSSGSGSGSGAGADPGDRSSSVTAADAATNDSSSTIAAAGASVACFSATAAAGSSWSGDVLRRLRLRLGSRGGAGPGDRSSSVIAACAGHGRLFGGRDWWPASQRAAWLRPRRRPAPPVGIRPPVPPAPAQVLGPALARAIGHRSFRQPAPRRTALRRRSPQATPWRAAGRVRVRLPGLPAPRAGMLLRCLRTRLRPEPGPEPLSPRLPPLNDRTVAIADSSATAAACSSPGPETSSGVPGSGSGSGAGACPGYRSSSVTAACAATDGSSSTVAAGSSSAAGTADGCSAGGSATTAAAGASGSETSSSVSGAGSGFWALAPARATQVIVCLGSRRRQGRLFVDGHRGRLLSSRNGGRLLGGRHFGYGDGRSSADGTAGGCSAGSSAAAAAGSSGSGVVLRCHRLRLWF